MRQDDTEITLGEGVAALLALGVVTFLLLV
jgi:hypothetical protein